MGQAFFPLDEELGLVAGQLTPLLAESLVRLGSWLPFAPAASMLAFFTQTTVSASTARRMTEASGAAAVSLHHAAAQNLAQIEGGSDPSERLYVGVDGAMVPLLGGAWAEVKTLTVGEVRPPVWQASGWAVHTARLSYFSSLADVDDFMAGAQVELHRRQVAQAKHVCGLSDGALWIQRFFDTCCPAARRILDFPHAATYLARAADAFFHAQPDRARAWFATQRRELHSGSAAQVVADLHHLSLLAYQQQASLAVQSTISDAHDYLKHRLPMIQYATFQAQGEPIGSGASESANKLVVERRLKGPGMHWQRTNVNPMLHLTTSAANDRWAELWPATVQQRRTLRRQRLLARHAPLPPPPPPLAPPPAKPPYRPAPDHPWRRQRFGRQRHRPAA